MAAGGPTDESGSQHRGWWIAAGLLALLLIAGLVILWIKAPDLYRAKDGAAQATATTRGGILTVAAALIAATAAGAGLYYTARTVRVNQQTLIETRRANREADRRDRYAKAIEQLGHDKAPVRLGAMYSLERLAQDNLEFRPAVVDVLCAYLRMPFEPPKRYEQDTESRAERTEDTAPSDATDRESERKPARATGRRPRLPPRRSRAWADHLPRPRLRSPRPSDRGRRAGQEELVVRQTAQRLLGRHL